MLLSHLPKIRKKAKSLDFSGRVDRFKVKEEGDKQMGGTDILYAKPSFVEGMARSIDLFGVLQEYNRSLSEEEADAWAIYSDFQAVGTDLSKAIKTEKVEIDR
jgi:hypothetical protein